MIKIGVCDDEKIWLREITKILETYSAKYSREISIRTYNSAAEVIYNNEGLDLLLLDIEMPGISGIELKDFFAQTAKNIAIIFISSFTEFMPDAFGRNVYGFLSKPFKAGELYEKLSKVIADIDSKVRIPLDEENSILSSEIFYIRACNKYVDVVTLSGLFIGFLSLGECEEQLPASNFCRVGKSYIINFDYVVRVKGVIEMTNGDIIKISRGKTMEIKEKYREFLRLQIMK